MHTNICTCPHLSIEDQPVDDIGRHTDSQEQDVHVTDDSGPLLGCGCADHIPRIVKRAVDFVSCVWFKRVDTEVSGYTYVAVGPCGVVMNGHRK